MFFKSYSCWYCITPPKSSSTCLTFSKNTFKCEIIGPNGVKKQCFEPNKGWGWMSNLTLRKGWNTFIIHSLFGTRCFLGQPPVSRALSLFNFVPAALHARAPSLPCRSTHASLEPSGTSPLLPLRRPVPNLRFKMTWESRLMVPWLDFGVVESD